MKKSSYFVILIMLSSLAIAPMMTQSDKAVNFFDAWRPQAYPTGIGCHNAGITSNEVAGGIDFGTTMVVVQPGENFTLTLAVEDFAGTVSAGDLLIGFNILDADNDQFMTETFAEVSHKLTSGDSDTPYEVEFTAPMEEGSFVMQSYAVTGDVDYFDYITGSIRVVVTNGVVGSGYVDEVVAHYDAIKDTSTTGYKWAETQQVDDNTYKPGMIKGAASIGNFMLDIYEENVRSSLFYGLNNEEIALPLDLATGAGDWIVSITETNATGSFFYLSYDVDDAVSTNTIHLPYYEGLAGVASYLGRLYRITHDSTYLTTAEGYLTFLLNVANTTNGWTAWNENFGDDIENQLSTRWSKGSTGIGAVMLEFYRLTGDVAYMNAALGVFEFLDDTKVVATEGVSWYRYATDDASGTYLGRWHGVAGVASFLMDLYEVTGTAAHKTLAFSAVDYVFDHAEDDGNGGVWFENAVGSSEYQNGWSRGGAGIGSILMRADRIDSAAGYTDILQDIFDHYVATAIPTENGWSFNDSTNTATPAASNPRIATSIGHGISGIAMFFLEAYQYTGEVQYRHAATMVGLGLKDLRLDTGLWEKSSAESYVSNNIYYGVGGVATFFHNYNVMGDPTTLDTAIDATKFLLDFAEVDGEGLKWAEKEGGVYKTGVLKGAAGNALELLTLYSRMSTELLFGGLTTNATYAYLEAAEAAMVWLEDVAVDLEGGKGWYEAYDGSNVEIGTVMKNSYYPGAAGIGDVFTRISQATGDQSYMVYAEGAADYLMAIANTTDGYAWRELYTDDINLRSTRWSYGSGGIGSFFLNLAVQTGSSTYLDVAEDTADFFLLTAIDQDEGKSWYRLADDDASGTYLGRWHGSAGTADLMMDLYAVTGNVTYLTAATDALAYVISETNVTGETASWENAVGSGEFQSGFSRGGAGIADMFLRAFLMTGNAMYTDYIDMALNWYLDNTADVDEGWAWVDSINYITPVASNLRIATGLGHGISGIIVMASEVFDRTHSPKAFAIMKNGIDYLESIKISNTTGTSWLKSTVEQYFDTTLYYGTAGVAMAMLDVSAFANEAPVLTADFVYDDVAMTVTADISVWEDIGIDTNMVTVDGTEVELAAVDGVYTVDVSALAAGSHTVEIKVTDVGGLSDDVSFTFTIAADETTPPVTTPPTTSEESTSPFPAFFMIMSILALGFIIRKRS